MGKAPPCPFLYERRKKGKQMVFSSAAFLFVFLPAVVCLERLMPGVRSKNVVLALCSLLFYGFGEPAYVLLLMASVVINYTAGRLIAALPGRKKLVAALAVVLDLGLLCVFKYTDFAIETLNLLPGVSVAPTGILLPAGISFFTFQGLSYVIDVYRDEGQVSRSFIKLMLYVAFFPQLIAGPIVKYHDVSLQIDGRQTNPALTADGVRRFIVGLSKKLLLSNTVGRMADMAFTATAQQLDARSAWLGALCYMMQIYFDFSGYSDMAIGLGRMFGFQFLENFDHPYASASIKEFWRRWHISLSSWFRDYLYIPMGGNRKGRVRTELNKVVVFFCTGLWHGASWNFVLWGLWHGAVILIEDALPKKLPGRKIWGRAVTLLTVLLSFVLFRADTLPGAGLMFSRMFGGFAATVESGALLRAMVTPLNLAVLGLSIVCSLPVLPKLRELAGGLLQSGRHVEPSHTGSALEAVSYAGAFALLLLCVMDLAGSDFNPFIYFRF